MIRGIHATLYARLTRTDVDLQALFEKRYAGEPFVDVMPPGSAPDTRCVRASNVARIAVHRPGDGDMVTVLVVDGQPRQGRRRPGGAEHEPDVRPARDDRARRPRRCCPRTATRGTALWWRRVRQNFGISRAAHGGAHAPAVVGARRDRRSRWSPSSPACGGGASTSARSSAASTARRSRRSSSRSSPRRRKLRAEAAELRARNSTLESELAMTRGAQEALQQAGRRALAARTRSSRRSWRSCRSWCPTPASRSACRSSGWRSSATATKCGATAC